MRLSEVTGSTPEARLSELGLELPPVPKAVADYVTHTQIGNIVYTSGMLPWIDGELKFTGRMGEKSDATLYWSNTMKAVGYTKPLEITNPEALGTSKHLHSKGVSGHHDH